MFFRKEYKKRENPIALIPALGRLLQVLDHPGLHGKIPMEEKSIQIADKSLAICW